VYSFAIILQEIVYRASPYFIDVDDPRSKLIYRVAQKNGATLLYSF